MKIIFAGTPPFAAAALSALHAAGHQIALVLSQPNRPAGRGMKLTPSAVTELAGSLQLRIDRPVSLKDGDVQQRLRDVGADIMVVAAYGLLLPPAVLTIPRFGCINIHGSLLPRWRGAAPVQRAIEAGDNETGINIMQMDAGLDTGPVLLERRIGIDPHDTSASLFAKLTELGAATVVEALENWPDLLPQPQSETGITYAKKITKNEATINWGESADLIGRQIRAFDPFPGCETTIGDEKLKIWQAHTADNVVNVPPGTVLVVGGDILTVACGEGALSITRVQRPGGKRIPVADWLRGRQISIQPGAQCK